MRTIPYNSHSSNYNFNSSMLKVGEMMEITDTELPEYYKQIVLRTYDNIVLLNSPKITWLTTAPLKGRKLLPGEGITLIQE